MLTSEKELIYGVFLTAIILLLLISLIILMVYQYIRVRLQKEKDILKAVFETQEAERNRIAEDLHDDIGARLSALKLQNELLITENLAREGKDLAVKNGVMVDNIVREVRRIVRNQASKYILENGLENELEALCYQYRSLKGINILLEYNDPGYAISMDFQVAIFRVIQELLHNTIKHANASEVQIRFNYHPSGVQIRYSDNGTGFVVNEKNNRGMGLKNIRTRAELYNGEVQIKSVPGKATYFDFIFFRKSIESHS